MARLPLPGQDDGTWGDVLNQFLLTAHTPDGSLKADAVQADSIGSSKLKDNSVTEPKLAMTNTPSASQVLTWDGTGMTWAANSGTGVTDHGALTGLGDDDHTQYHNDTRGDARYYTKSQIDTSLSGKEPVVTGGSTNQYYRGDKSWQTLDKTAVGLNAVDNTADTAKPVSTAQQTALNLKANAANPVFTGTVTIPDGALAIADTAGLQTALDGKVSAGQTYALDDLSDVSTSGAISGQVLKYNGSNWAPGTDATGGAGDPTMGGDLSGTASNAQLVAGAVGTTELATAAVTDVKVAAGAAIAQTKIANLPTDLAAKVDVVTVGQADGVASLNSTAKVPDAQLTHPILFIANGSALPAVVDGAVLHIYDPTGTLS